MISFFGSALVAQDSIIIVSWHASWDDAFHEWDVMYELPNGEIEEGEVEATWHHLSDWSTWDVHIGDYDGIIRQKWNKNDQLWEFRMDGNITTCETKWSGDYSEWTMSFNGDIKIKWLSKSYRDGNNWFFEDPEYGVYEFYTEYLDDPRDWIVFDDTAIDLPVDIKILCGFIAMFRSTKQYRQR